MSFAATKIWREIVAEERALLYATPERVRQIEERQPESQSWGRPLLYFPEAGGRRSTGARRKSKSHPVEEEPEVVVPPWRKTFEFTGDEGALAEEIDGEVAEDLRTEVVAA